MAELTVPKQTYEISLPKILSEELHHIRPSALTADDSVGAAHSAHSSKNLNEVFKDLHDAQLTGLCFSGGGIRSATFGLGIVQALAKYDLLDKFDYLSTVSGGGYLGAWLSAWIRREQMNHFETKIRLDKLASLAGKISDRLAKTNLTPSRREQLLRRREKIAATSNLPKAELLKVNLSRRANVELFKEYDATQKCGIRMVQDELNKHLTAEAECPNIEPKQFQYLREYSNYMSPKVGLLSADTWTFLGIYTRNLFLNWTIFIPLILAMLLIPRILLALTDLPANKLSLILILSGGLLSGIAGVAFTVDKLPSKALKGDKIKFNTDAGVFLTVILPMLGLAFAATTFWAWLLRSPSPIPKYAVFGFIIFSAAIFFFGNLVYFIYKKIAFGKTKMRAGEFFAALLSSVVSGFLTWLLANNFFDANYFAEPEEHLYRLPIYIGCAVPLYLLCFSVSSTVFVGLYSRVATDADREWLARQGAWFLIVGGAWVALNGLVLLAPVGLVYLIAKIVYPASHEDFWWLGYIKDSIVPIIVAVSGVISLVGGFSGKSKVKDEPAKSKLSVFLAVAPKFAAVIFLAFIFIALAYLTSLLLVAVGGFLHISLGNSTGWMLMNDDILKVLQHSSIGYLSLWLVVLAVFGGVMSCFVNVNKFSLHAAYRDRLIRAYLGASHIRRSGNTFTGFDDTDNFQLHRLKGQKPFHIINATLNLVAGKNLAWQNRKAASFTMSPLHCGSWLLGYRRTNEYCRNTNLPNCEHLRYCNKFGKPCASVEGDNCQLKGKALRLGTAMTISGAAANPNMGYYSSPVVTFLMSLFNIRLGWWLGNTGAIGDQKDIFGDSYFTKPSPSNAVLPLLNETLGRTDENKRFLNVTDGGHFENLGLYEMVLRRCKLIVLSDAAADDNFTFGEISNAIEKCKVDLGVDIKFRDGINIYSRHTKEETARQKKRFAIAEIIYPEKNRDNENYKGFLLYIRPTIYGPEPTEIKHYADANRTFPHQSTSDQLYDEKQFEAYRALGFYIADEIVKTKSSAALFKMLTKSGM